MPVLLSLHTVTCLEAIALSFLTPSTHSIADHKSGYVSHGLKWFLLALNWLPHQSQLLRDHFSLIFVWLMWFLLPVTLELEWLSLLLHWNCHYPLDQFQLHCNFSPFPSLYRGSWPIRTVVPLFFIIFILPQPCPQKKTESSFSYSVAVLQAQRWIISHPSWSGFFSFCFLFCPDYGNGFFFFSTGSKNRDTICRCKPRFFLTLSNVCKPCNRWAFFLCMPLHWVGETADTSPTRGGNFFSRLCPSWHNFTTFCLSGAIGSSPLPPPVFSMWASAH